MFQFFCGCMKRDNGKIIRKFIRKFELAGAKLLDFSLFKTLNKHIGLET